MIRNDNAQGEYYITDMVRLLSGVRDAQGEPRYRVRAVPVDHPEWVQGFNSPDELLAIQDYVRQQAARSGRRRPKSSSRPQLKPTQYATVRQWLAKIEAGRPALKRWLRKDLRPARGPAPAEVQGPRAACWSVTENASAWTRRCASSGRRAGST